MQTHVLIADNAQPLLEVAKSTVMLPNVELGAGAAPGNAEHLVALAVNLDRATVTPGAPAAHEVQALGQEIGRAALLAAMNAIRNQSGFTNGPAPAGAVTLPRTGQPLPNGQNDVLDWALGGDLQRIRVTLYLPVSQEISTHASALLDTGEEYNAFFAGGAVHRLSLPWTLYVGDGAAVELFDTSP